MDSIVLEEYKFAKERIRKADVLRFQIITFNVTAYGLILKLTNVEAFSTPVMLACITILCLKMYTFQRSRQYLTSAYIITRFEKRKKELGYETMLSLEEDLGYKSSNRVDNWLTSKIGKSTRGNTVFIFLGLVSFFLSIWIAFTQCFSEGIIDVFFAILISLFHAHLFYMSSRKVITIKEYCEKMEEEISPEEE